MDLTGVAVLVVDDQEDATDLFAAMLEHAGAVVQRATNLLEALDRFAQVEIGIVVTDLAMPGATGWDVMREVRIRKPGVPAIAVTAQLIPGARSLMDQGFSAVVFKPVEPAQLVAVVGHFAGGSGGSFGTA